MFNWKCNEAWWIKTGTLWKDLDETYHENNPKEKPSIMQLIIFFIIFWK